MTTKISRSTWDANVKRMNETYGAELATELIASLQSEYEVVADDVMYAGSQPKERAATPRKAATDTSAAAASAATASRDAELTALTRELMIASPAMSYDDAQARARQIVGDQSRDALIGRAEQAEREWVAAGRPNGYYDGSWRDASRTPDERTSDQIAEDLKVDHEAAKAANAAEVAALMQGAVDQQAADQAAARRDAAIQALVLTGYPREHAEKVVPPARQFLTPAETSESDQLAAALRGMEAPV